MHVENNHLPSRKLAIAEACGLLKLEEEVQGIYDLQQQHQGEESANGTVSYERTAFAAYPNCDAASIWLCAVFKLAPALECCQSAARLLSWYLGSWRPRADQRSKHESYGQKCNCTPIDTICHWTAACGSPRYGLKMCVTAAHLTQDSTILLCALRFGACVPHQRRISAVDATIQLSP